MLARDPECGEIIQGTGGVRKVRVALPGRGKSGGARVIYYFHSERLPVFALTVFAKNEKADFDSGGAKRDGHGRSRHQAAAGVVSLMSKKAFDSIMAGLGDALAYAKGDRTRGRATAFQGRDLDVGRVRGKVGLSQDEFARAFGVSVGTLRNWEQKRVRPDGPARVLLTVIDRDPVAVLRALRIGPGRTSRRRRRAA